MRLTELFFAYLRQHIKVILLYLLCVAVFALTFALYHIPISAIVYPALLSTVIGLIFFIYGFTMTVHRHRRIEKLIINTDELVRTLPSPHTISDRDHQAIINALYEEQRLHNSESAVQYADMVDYYTVWAHQIKTPIASMRLTLESEDSSTARKLCADLNRIEQYTDMVMAYIRLDSDSSDLVLRRYALDDIIRQAVRKFAGEFIARKIRLNYSPVELEVVTDEKWLCFVMEQLLSNALKYTQEGEISIYRSSHDTLALKDTGIGIAAEDLPRIFEKGYTGYNGRADKKASGLGLYLCRRVCAKLGHEIYAASQIGKGTVISLRFSQDDGIKE